MVDLHGSQTPTLLELDLDPPEDIPGPAGSRGYGPFTIPFRCFIPEKLDGFLAAEKNISQSRLANGATRLQPSTMLMGQAAGAIAALAVKHRVQPRQLDPVLVQRSLLDAGCLLFVTPLRDVARDSREWAAIQLTTVHGMLQPANGWFGPDRPVTAAQFAEVKSRRFGNQTDDGTNTDAVTRADFAAALIAGMNGTPVELRFAGGDVEPSRPITRSEAAQIIAEFLELRAVARMTRAAQTLNWSAVRPATIPPAADLTVSLLGPKERWWMGAHQDFRQWNPAPTFRSILQRLSERKVIDSPDYWLEHAVEGGQCDGDQVAGLLVAAARSLAPSATAAHPAEILHHHGVISRPEYWIKNAQRGERCDGRSVAALIRSLASRFPDSPQ